MVKKSVVKKSVIKKSVVKIKYNKIAFKWEYLIIRSDFLVTMSGDCTFTLLARLGQQHSTEAANALHVRVLDVGGVGGELEGQGYTLVFGVGGGRAW